ncbi:MAG: protein kinase [Planctomycetaceae bacterium]|nr:protein kinase [Planctomycetaceae bacterium]
MTSNSGSTPSTVDQARDSVTLDLTEIVQQIVGRWHRDSQPDTQAALLEHPELQAHASLVVDLAYEEYCQRREQGESVDHREFCCRFPQVEASLERLIADHDWLVSHAASLLDRAHPTPVWPKLGEQVLDFTLVQPLGRGAVARTFVARQRALGDRLVAIKLTPSSSQEARTLGRLHHTGIVPIYSVEHDPERRLSLMVMPYLGGATLEHLINRMQTPKAKPLSGQLLFDTIAEVNASLPTVDPLPPAEYDLAAADKLGTAIHLVSSLAAALQHSHSKAIIHRDLKPSNVLLTPAGQPMLLDFHLADDPQREVATVGGTLAYMSPEQLHELRSGVRNPQIDGRADIYSLGVLFLQMLTGKVAFRVPRGLPVPQTIELHETLREIRWSRDRIERQGIEPAFAPVIERCLRVDPAARPASADAFIRELHACQHEMQYRSRRSWLRGLGSLALGAFATWGLATRLLKESPPGPAVAPVVDSAALFAEELRAGRACLEQQKFAEAATHFESAARHNPAAGLPSLGNGKAQLALKNLDAAAYHFSVARSRLQDISAITGTAETYSLQGRYDEAIRYWRQVRSKLGDDPAVLNNLGHALAKSHVYPEAERIFNDLIAQHPELQQPYLNRLYLSYSRAVVNPNFDPTAMLADAETALRIGPASGSLYSVYAALLVRASANNPKLLDQALVAYGKALEAGMPLAAIKTMRGHESLVAHPGFAALQESSLTATQRFLTFNPQLVMPVAVQLTWPEETKPD